MFSPPSHPFSPPHASTSSPQAWHPTTTSSSTTSHPNNNTQIPPRTVERKRRAYPYFDLSHANANANASSIDTDLDLDPLTGLPTPAQTAKREKSARLADATSLSAQAENQNPRQSGSDSPPPPPTPGSVNPHPGAGFGNGLKGKTLTYMSSAYGQGHGNRYGGFGMGMLTPEQDGPSDAMGDGMSTGMGMESNQILGGTFGRKRRAGLTFAQQMGLLSSSSSSTTCSSFTAMKSSPGSSSKIDLTIDTPTSTDPLPSVPFSNHTRHLSLPHPNLNPDESSLHAQAHPNSIFGQAIGIGMGMRGHHKNVTITKSSQGQNQNQKRGGKKSSVDSVRLGGAFRLDSGGPGSHLTVSQGGTRRSNAKIDHHGDGERDGERLLGPAKILLDGGANPFLVPEEEDDQIGMHIISPKIGHVRRLFESRQGRESFPPVEQDGQDVDMDNNDHTYGFERQACQQENVEEEEEEEEGDYEIEHQQPPLTSTSETSSFADYASATAANMDSPDSTPTKLSSQVLTPMEKMVEQEEEGEAGMRTPEDLTPLAGKGFGHQGMGGGLDLGSMTPMQSTPRATFDFPLARQADFTGPTSTTTPSIRRPTAALPSTKKRVWPKPTLGPSSGGAEEDDEENPFLVGPGRKGKVMSVEERERRRLEAGRGERETISYVFRGTKTQFANPYYHLSSQSTPRTSKLDPGHMDFSPAPLPKPRLLWKEAHAKSSVSESASASSGSKTAGTGRTLGGGVRRLGLDVDGDEGMDGSDDDGEDAEEDQFLTARPARRLLFGSGSGSVATKAGVASGASPQARITGTSLGMTRGIKHERDGEDHERDENTPREKKRPRIVMDSF